MAKIIFKLNVKSLFTAITKGIVDFSFGNWAFFAKDSIDAVASFMEIKKSPEKAFKQLVLRSLLRAMFDLLESNVPDLKRDMPQEWEGMLEDLGYDEPIVIEFTREQLTNPKSMPILDTIKPVFAKWLTDMHCEPARANTIVDRLPQYFVVALDEEWKEHPDQYALLTDIETPFTVKSDIEKAWWSYSAYLAKQVAASMLSETFSLEQIYIPLRAYWEELPKAQRGKDEVESVSRSTGNRQRNVIWLDEDLEEWIDNGKRDNALRVLSGGPGSGKSTFAKIFAARMAQKPGLRTFYIPLHLFDMSVDLITGAGNFVKTTQLLPYNPLDNTKDSDRLFIIFDGIDELPLSDRAAIENAREFVREVEKFVTGRNSRKCKVKVLITGRTLAVEASRAELRKEGQILFLLPFYLTEEMEVKAEWKDDNILIIDQRAEWWKRYGALTGKDYQRLPKELAVKGLEEITAEPLLNYLVALSYEQHDSMQFGPDTNLNEIYENLILQVHKRAWGEGGPLVGDLSEKDFLHILEEIALCAWHGRGRTVTVGEIENRCKQSGMLQLLEKLQHGAKTGANVLRLLTAFYFQKRGGVIPGQETFEFTHKSFREYLTAGRITRMHNQIYRQLKQHQEDYQFGWNENEALKHWAMLTGPAVMDIDLYNYLARQVALEHRRNCKEGKESHTEELQKTLIRLIDHVLRYRLPMHQIPGNMTYKEMKFQARNAEEALLASLCAYSAVTGKISKINWPQDNSAGAWIKFLQGQRKGSENKLSLSCLARIDFSKQIFYLADLFSANLLDARLNEAKLERINLMFANLVGADLSGANLKEADLENVSIDETNFNGANLKGTILEG
ncbi:MAG TPA: pentapeptide repeat-containing protein [bacterium]|nr:pentapeptide repeat-containing protein [bacterium]